MPRRSALIVPVPEAEPAVAELRLAGDSSAALGVPAHVTVLFPFLPPAEIDLGAVRALVARHAAFTFALDRVERFDHGAVWLHPDPSEPFARLTEAVWRRWPQCPPYEGKHDAVIPHLTVSERPATIEVALPIAARATEVALIEEEGPGGRWSVRARFPLAGV